MKRIFLILINSLIAVSLWAQQDAVEPSPIDWQTGPGIASIADMAEIKLPEGYLFTDSQGTRVLMESMQNPITGTEVGFYAPEDISWFVVFEFDSIGYVKDDEKGNLDADAMLASMKEANKAGNEMRRERGWETIDLIGWAKEPFYNPQTNNLEWATLLSDESGEQIVNYNTRLLGRKGVMAVTLVTTPEELDSILVGYQQALGTYTYTTGHKYAEWTKGDKIAQYGLTGLVVGGSAALAAKTGLLAKFWKLLLIPIIAIGAFFKRFFNRS